MAAASRRLLSNAVVVIDKTEVPVPIAQLRRLARVGLLTDINATLAPLLTSHTITALSALSSVGLPTRATLPLGTNDQRRGGGAGSSEGKGAVQRR